MKPKKTNLCSLIPALVAFAIATGSASAVTTLIDKTFDGNDTNDIGPGNFQQVTNGLGTGPAGSSNTTTGLITTGGSGGGNAVNTAYGLNYNTLVTVPVGTTSLTATYVISSAPASVSTLIANGMFFGLVSGTNATSSGAAGLYNQDPRAFGYVAGSLNGDHSMGLNRDNPSATILTALPSVPSNASFANGFTVSFTMYSDNTWAITTTGLSTNADGTGGYTGTLDTVNGFDFATFITGGVGMISSLQTGPSLQLDIDRMTLEAIPEPSIALLGGLGLLALLRRRR